MPSSKKSLGRAPAKAARPSARTHRAQATSAPRPATGQEHGRHFEEQVARLYQALGYEVTRDVAIGNQQVDLVAERFVAGIGRVRLLIECKFKTAASVSNQDIFDLQTVFNSLRTRGRFTNAVLVTNTRFSKEANGAAEADGASAPIHLRTISQLEDEILNLSDSLSSYVIDYQESDISKTYVELSGVGSIPHTANGHVEELGPAAIAWINSRKKGLLSLLADFGSGKSTLLRNIKYRLCVSRLEASSTEAPIPVLLRLRELRDFNTLDEYLDYALHQEFRKTVPLSIFWRLVGRGQIALLLDGFDEMNSTSDVDRRKASFLKISPLITRSGGATILTCRPQFFVSLNEYREMLSEIEAAQPRLLLSTVRAEEQHTRDLLDDLTQVNRSLRDHFLDKSKLSPLPASAFGHVSLNPLSDDRIQAYLARLDHRFRTELQVDAQAVLSFLQGIYDLSDLIKRPLLLEMIVETLFTRRIDIGDKTAHVNTARLYDIYTSLKLDIEGSKAKGRFLLSTQERRDFSELLAIEMQHQNVGAVSYQQLLAAIARQGNQSASLRGVLETETPEAIATDIRLCSFLTLDERGHYCFVHKSFMEFFVARHIASAVDGSGDLSLLGIVLPSAVLHFFGSFLALDERLRERSMELIASNSGSDSTSSSIRANILAALLHSGMHLSSHYFAAAEIRSMSFPRSTLNWFRLQRCTFTDCQWPHLSLKECTVDSLKLGHSRIENLFIDESTLSTTATESRIRQLRTTESSVSITGAGLTIESYIATGGTTTLDGTALIGSASFSKVVVRFLASMGTIVFRSSTFSECTVDTSWRADDDVVEWRSSTFKDCVIRGLNCKGLVAAKQTTSGPTLIAANASLENCEGFVFYVGNDAELSQLIGNLAWLGKVAIVSVDRYLVDPTAQVAIDVAVRKRLGDDAASSLSRLAGDIRRRRAEAALSHETKTPRSRRTS